MYKFTPLIEYIGDLAAKSSVTIPVIVERIPLDGEQPLPLSAIRVGGGVIRVLPASVYESFWPVWYRWLSATNRVGDSR